MSAVRIRPGAPKELVCGDLNVAAEEIDLKNPKTNRMNAGFTDQEREKFRILKAAGFVDTFRYLHPEEVKYSWWSYMFKAREKNAGWRKALDENKKLIDERQDLLLTLAEFDPQDPVVKALLKKLNGDTDKEASFTNPE